MIFEELLDVAIKAAHLSSDIILEFSDKSKVVDYKGRTDLVTIADKKSEKLIIDTILDKFQDHSILAEESGSNSKGSKYMWLIDPYL